MAKGSIEPQLPLGASRCGDLSSNSFALTESYVLGQSGEQISELGSSGNFSLSHAYANGHLLATDTLSGFPPFPPFPPVGVEKEAAHGLRRTSHRENCGSSGQSASRRLGK